MRIGIDLTWLKPKVSGGVQFFAENLINGFLKLEDKNEYVLFLAKDNAEYLSNYFQDERVTKIVCNTKAFDVIDHLLWQNISLYHVLKKYHITFCYFPVYEKGPSYRCKKIKTVATLHDIQAYHYPEYFPKMLSIWFRYVWKKATTVCDKLVTITEYTRQDLMQHFTNLQEIAMIHVPVTLDNTEIEDFDQIKNQYSIEENNYYYTVCSMHKHKNLMTLIKVMKKIKENDEKLPHKLVISGVGGPNKEALLQQIKEMNMEEDIILTNFVSNAERNSFMKHSNVFLFPSIFEGFGMPPIEALALGSKVITTNCTSLPEVTKGKCTYVENPFKEEEWIEKIKQVQSKKAQVITFEEYKDINIARQYLDLFYEIEKRK